MHQRSMNDGEEISYALSGSCTAGIALEGEGGPPGALEPAGLLLCALCSSGQGRLNSNPYLLLLLPAAP